ncbi:uncharacterized protein LOC110092118 isoform X2 [Dendrobium catenatum]|uniref:uncharacterized protein LOC110092118 isoform X2 n=1 Tax=Dendrobium catenatum TaxID=906689 RepID=UPI00109F7398|nr:uncharacterized protein LOC110092118 isoform X2 [Dendrobium catenatum]
MAAAVPSFLPLSLDSSLRPMLISSSSVLINRSRSPSLSFSSTRSAAGAIEASSPGRVVFLDDLGLYRLQTIDKYKREGPLGGGWLEIRPMEDGEIDPIIQLLSESFIESMGMPPRYVPLLTFIVRQYVMGRRLLLPHAVMLVGFYRDDGKEPELACTAEISFDTFGANVAPPTPLPPKDCPYICNMAVKKDLRRVIDTGPLKLYKKAEYKIVKTDSRLVWLTLQRRKHLLEKEVHIEQDEAIAVLDNNVNQQLW